MFIKFFIFEKKRILILLFIFKNKQAVYSSVSDSDYIGEWFNISHQNLGDKSLLVYRESI